MDKFSEVLQQISGVLTGESDPVANTANFVAVLNQQCGYFWTGIYFVKDRQLVLGPFQGPVGCTRIGLGKGVCGTAWKEKRTIYVPDVNQFAGHIACNSTPQSELVVPLIQNDVVMAVLDIDSTELDGFLPQQISFFEQAAKLLSEKLQA